MDAVNEFSYLKKSCATILPSNRFFFKADIYLKTRNNKQRVIGYIKLSYLHDPLNTIWQRKKTLSSFFVEERPEDYRV